MEQKSGHRSLQLLFNCLEQLGTCQHYTSLASVTGSTALISFHLFHSRPVIHGADPSQFPRNNKDKNGGLAGRAKPTRKLANSL